jgi:hypothetical protein
MAKLIYRVEISDIRVKQIINDRNLIGNNGLHKLELCSLPYGPYQDLSWKNLDLFEQFLIMQSENKYEDACWYNAFDWMLPGNFSYEPRKTLRSGCYSKKSVTKWFNESLGLLHKNDFVLATYAVDGHMDYDPKSKQVRFDRNDASFVRREPLIT